MIGEPLIALGIALVIGMLTTVHLDDEPLLPADKVDEIRPD